MKNILKYLRKKIGSGRGFTLIEVLLAIGILGSAVLTVSYMNASNLREIRRHTAESYADLIAQEQFSALLAFRNQITFDQDPSTNWDNSIESKIPQNIYQALFFYHLEFEDGKWKIKEGEKTASKLLNNEGGIIIFTYGLCFNQLDPNPGENNLNLKNGVKVSLKVKWKDGNEKKSKIYYTILGNYLDPKI